MKGERDESEKEEEKVKMKVRSNLLDIRRAVEDTEPSLFDAVKHPSRAVKATILEAQQVLGLLSDEVVEDITRCAVVCPVQKGCRIHVSRHLTVSKQEHRQTIRVQCADRL